MKPTVQERKKLCDFKNRSRTGTEQANVIKIQNVPVPVPVLYNLFLSCTVYTDISNKIGYLFQQSKFIL